MLAHPAVAPFPAGGVPIPSFQSLRSDRARLCTSVLIFFWDFTRISASAVLCSFTCKIVPKAVWSLWGLGGHLIHETGVMRLFDPSWPLPYLSNLQ